MKKTIDSSIVYHEERLKPIFHCDANTLALGPGVGLAPKRHNFALRILKTIAYIPLRRKIPGVGGWRWVDASILHWRYQHVGIFWRYLTLKFALAPTPTPDASQWNIGGVGPSGFGADVGHVHFMFFVLISFAFCSQRKPSFQWNMGLTCWYLKTLKFALPPTRNLKFAFPPTPTPNACQWNIGGVGSPGVGACVGHVHFMLFVSISFALGHKTQTCFSGIWAKKIRQLR